MSEIVKAVYESILYNDISKQNINDRYSESKFYLGLTIEANVDWNYMAKYYPDFTAAAFIERYKMV